MQEPAEEYNCSRDVAEILEAKGRTGPKPKGLGASRGLCAPKEKDSAKEKSAKGLSREVFALTGGAAAATSPQKASSPFTFFRDKRKGISKVQWEWKPFSNCARTDSLELRHWQKKGLEISEYAFARFNKKLQVLSYTDKEYDELLTSSEWSRSETDTLMSLIHRFGMNFFLVQDRWNGNRSIESLKDRFYTIQRLLTQSRGLAADDGAENVLLARPYNAEHEIQRKLLQEQALKRSKREEEEEQEILETARKLELLLKKRRVELKRKDKGGDRPVAFPSRAPGSVVLRSQIMLAEPEPSTTRAVLDGIGLPLRLASAQAQAQFALLRADVAALLEWHARLARRKALCAANSRADGANSAGTPGRKKRGPPAAGAGSPQQDDGGGGGGKRRKA